MRDQHLHNIDRTIADRKESLQSVNRGTADSVASDDGLRAALTELQGKRLAGTVEWEAIGAEVLRLANRDAAGWRQHSAEYASAYVLACVEFLAKKPSTVIEAVSPWGLVVTRGRTAAQAAVAAEISCGLTGRDSVTHRTRFADVPRVVSLAALAHDPIDGIAS